MGVRIDLKRERQRRWWAKLQAICAVDTTHAAAGLLMAAGQIAAVSALPRRDFLAIARAAYDLAALDAANKSGTLLDMKPNS